MKFTPETPKTPGYYVLKSSDHNEPMPVTLFMHGDPKCLWIETDNRCCVFDDFVHDTAKCEWCRLVPAEELKKAWLESYRATSDDGYQEAGEWLGSRAKRVMEGEES